MWKIQIFLFIIFAIKLSESNLIVKTSGGQLRGIRVRTGLFTSYLAFKGIPYAEPPIGNLRFRAPIPHHGWQGIRDASKHGNVCPTNGVIGIGLLPSGDENCLFLNVYTTNVNANLPVLFWIYGGAFILGDGNSLIYGPDELMKENIVVVTFNYRLSVFGFLSTGDEHAQGNYGLKDMVLALKWVKENIKNFGGDPNKITIVGQSAGAVSVHHLMLSQMTQGLFHQAIMMSGSALSPFSFQTNPRQKAENLARKIGLIFNSTEEMVEKLRKVDFREILKHDRGLLNQDDPQGLVSFDFTVTVEPENSIDERLVTLDPEKVLLSGNFQKIPAIIGTVNKEGILDLMRNQINPNYMTDFNDHPEYFVPNSYNISKNDTNSINEVANAFRKIYFNDKKITKDSTDEFAIFMTDAGYKFSTDRAIQFMAKNQSKIYSYEFFYDGALNFIKTITFQRSYNGACHADDLFYLFNPEFPTTIALPNNHAFKVRQRMVRLWSNFVKTGNPTPNRNDNLLRIQWPTFDQNDKKYLEIGYDLSVKIDNEKLKIWHDFQRKFTNHD
ncbi:hypothetical protein PVAND_017299 [Polypedilum vanderplanki]|uniref:Carboxylic ester hydrolase n=1 Tax=Polypedilum vanderplanki TaxID=319348 RepID=A0A9J6BHV4_POLVA|nr:hypothetical protein PVAND_017299 [Polypedilum vanderplanki]